LFASGAYEYAAVVEIITFAESIPTDWEHEDEESFLDRAQSTLRDEYPFLSEEALNRLRFRFGYLYK
jgi:hypothetical protein